MKYRNKKSHTAGSASSFSFLFPSLATAAPHHDLLNIQNTKQNYEAVEPHKVMHAEQPTSVPEKNNHVLNAIPLIILFLSQTTPYTPFKVSFSYNSVSILRILTPVSFKIIVI